MQYVLAISAANYGKQASFLALQFAQTLIQQHQIQQIFFFQDGAHNANKLTYPANDEFHLVKAWQDFSQNHNVPLHLCVAGAQRRGIVDSQTSPTEETNLAEGFVLAGLGEFSQAVLSCDRLIQF